MRFSFTSGSSLPHHFVLRLSFCLCETGETRRTHFTCSFWLGKTVCSFYSFCCIESVHVSSVSMPKIRAYSQTCVWLKQINKILVGSVRRRTLFLSQKSIHDYSFCRMQTTDACSALFCVRVLKVPLKRQTTISIEYIPPGNPQLIKLFKWVHCLAVSSQRPLGAPFASILAFSVDSHWLFF